MKCNFEYPNSFSVMLEITNKHCSVPLLNGYKSPNENPPQYENNEQLNGEFQFWKIPPKWKTIKITKRWMADWLVSRLKTAKIEWSCVNKIIFGKWTENDVDDGGNCIRHLLFVPPPLSSSVSICTIRQCYSYSLLICNANSNRVASTIWEIDCLTGHCVIWNIWNAKVKINANNFAEVVNEVCISSQWKCIKLQYLYCSTLSGWRDRWRYAIACNICQLETYSNTRLFQLQNSENFLKQK